MDGWMDVVCNPHQTVGDISMNSIRFPSQGHIEDKYPPWFCLFTVACIGWCFYFLKQNLRFALAIFILIANDDSAFNYWFSPFAIHLKPADSFFHPKNFAILFRFFDNGFPWPLFLHGKSTGNVNVCRNELNRPVAIGHWNLLFRQIGQEKRNKSSHKPLTSQSIWSEIFTLRSTPILHFNSNSIISMGFYWIIASVRSYLWFETKWRCESS